MMNTEATPKRIKPSLFPYIKTGDSGIRIDFEPVAGPLDKKSPSFPFEILDHPDPLAYLVKARLVTDAGSEIEKLFILLQRDQVQPVKNKSLPADNPAMNQCWKQAFSHYCGDRAFDDCLLKLDDQLTDNVHLLPFQPLFYCTYKNQFFPPPCPLCGGMLDLCRDNDMLNAADLHSYIHSLKRYLFCPTCYQLAGETDFYTCAPTGPDENLVKSDVELISEFKSLATSSCQTHRFPCRTCLEVGDCHAPNGPLLTRISPVAFYPFHMLIFKADAVSVDNLSILRAAENDFAPSPKVDQDPARTLERNPAQTVERDPDNTDEQDPAEPTSVDPDKSISMILKRLIIKWETEAVKNTIKPPLIEAAEQPSQVPPYDPSGEPSRPAPVLNENPDFQETIIVSPNRDRSPTDKKPNPPIDADIPETIIFGATKPEKPGYGHPELRAHREPADHRKTDRHATRRPPSLIPDAIRPSQPDILPETMIVRPPDPNAPITRGQKVTSDTMPERPDKPGQPGQQDHRPNTKLSFNRSPEPEKKFLKTFTLGSNRYDPEAFGKDFSTPPVNGNKPQMPSKPDLKDKLAETIIVSPQKKDKDRK
jgi:hypothetical protein